MFTWLLFTPCARLPMLSFAYINGVGITLLLLLIITAFFSFRFYLKTKKRAKTNARILHKTHTDLCVKNQVANDLGEKLIERNKELKQKSKELLQKTILLEKQNLELSHRTAALKQQEEQILRLNVLLEIDHIPTVVNTFKVPIKLRELDDDLGLFAKQFADKESCYKFLADVKWQAGYFCTKCGNASYCSGKSRFNRRCTKCTYEESVLCQTIFENNRIPIQKAFYLLYLIYSYKGNISSHQLSQKLGIRQSTCWTYASKIKKVMEERKREIKGVDGSGWSKLVLKKDV
ncbi:MAG: hypothetical protein EOO87_00155 [Pedobacter sp.]|nr:MAG: hypothetical protein EOO87_00155 [Pedobacter sp.]